MAILQTRSRTSARRTRWAFGIIVLAACAGFFSAGASAKSLVGCRPLRAIFYASSDWLPLANALAAAASPCAEYYITVPPPSNDKTQVRSGVASQIDALGANFHAVAEINVTAWQAWVTSTGNSWADAGVDARSEMSAAGFNVSAGDTWAVNELPSSVRQGTGTARSDMEGLVGGLYDGDGSAPTKGIVFAEGIGQPTNPLTQYKANVESWLQDANFWNAITPDVSDFLQENYGDIRDYAVSGADVPTRIGYLQAYLDHELQLVSVGPASVAASQSFLAATYAPLATAAWAYSTDYGYTSVPYLQMEDYVSAQVDAMRAYDATIGWSADRIGFAWAPSNTLGLSTSDFNTQTAALLAQLATAIQESADPAAPGAGACTAPWCETVIAGAAFTPAWSTFSTWTPTRVSFASAPVSVVAGSASTVLSVQPTIGGIVTALPIDTDVLLSSSSAGGSFSTSATGPWSATLGLVIPAGSTSASFYMLDSDTGSPTVTAAVGDQVTTQLETVTEAAPTITALSPQQGVIGSQIEITGTGFTGATAVSFNGTAASFTPSSDSEIMATVPAGATSGTVSVTTPAGTGASVSPFGVLPSISGFSPGSGPVGTSVAITGGGFSGATAVSFDGVQAQFSVNSSSSITAVVPAGAASGTIAITTPAGSATSATSFGVIPLSLGSTGNTVVFGLGGAARRDRPIAHPSSTREARRSPRRRRRFRAGSIRATHSRRPRLVPPSRRPTSPGR